MRKPANIPGSISSVTEALSLAFGRVPDNVPDRIAEQVQLMLDDTMPGLSGRAGGHDHPEPRDTAIDRFPGLPAAAETHGQAQDKPEAPFDGVMGKPDHVPDSIDSVTEALELALSRAADKAQEHIPELVPVMHDDVPAIGSGHAGGRNYPRLPDAATDGFPDLPSAAENNAQADWLF